MDFISHEDYFCECLSDTRHLLESIESQVEAVVPNATRCIRYKTPTFRQERERKA